MGMYDEVICSVPLPDGRVVPDEPFQTKSLGGGLGQYTITPGGRLVRHRCRYEEDGVVTHRSGLRVPRFRRVPLGDIDLEYHGDLLLYGSWPDTGPAEYVARFTHGTL
ncbi:MAG: hypothetical protein U0871_04705 [Gemmataceae bacterium]